MEAYHKTRQTSDEGDTMDMLLFPFDDAMIMRRKGLFSFEWGLDGHEQLSKAVRDFQSGRMPAGWAMKQVFDDFARDAIDKGQKYRLERQEPPHTSVHSLGPEAFKPAPDYFQESAGRLYRDAGIE